MTSADRDREMVRDVYETIADEYDERIPRVTPMDRRFTETENAFLLGKVTARDRVLDMECGTGRFTVPLTESAASVVRLDLFPSMLAAARAKADARGAKAKFREGDICDLPFEDQSFDVVTSMLALMHVPVESRERVFAKPPASCGPGDGC